MKNKYGKVFTIWIPKPTIIIVDNKVIMDTIVREGDKFGDRATPENSMKLVAGGNYGLVNCDNSAWKEQRRFALHSLRDVGYLSNALQETAKLYAQEAVSHWKKEGAEGQPIDPSNMIIAAVANVIWQLTFGRTLSFDDPAFVDVKNLVHEFFLHMKNPIMVLYEAIPAIIHLDFLFGYPIRNHQQTCNDLFALVQKEIDNCEKNLNVDDPPQCYVDSFYIEMKRREEKGEPLDYFTRHQLLMASVDMWVAGLETTLTTLRFAIYFLMANPEVQRKMQREIDEKIGKRQVSTDDQKVLPYCMAVLQESQRVGNIGPLNFFRQTNQETVIDGYRIPARTAVIPQVPTVHIDPEEFERPEYFCPERHINEKGEFVKDNRINPFSMGKRSCLGEGLARMELFVYLITFVQNLTFASPTKIPPELKVDIGLTRDPLPFKVLITSRD